MPRMLTMVAADVRQQILNKSIFIFGLAVPMALMWVFSLIFVPLDESLEPITVAVSVPQDDPLAQVVPQVLEELDDDQLQVSVELASSSAVPTLVADGEVGAGLVVPEGFSADLVDGLAPAATMHLPEGSGLEAEVVASVLDAMLRQVTATSRTSVAADTLGASEQEIQAMLGSEAATGPAVRWGAGETANEQLSPQASIVAGQAGFFLLFTVGFGVLGLVVEREWGTLSRLMSMPFPHWWVPASKGLSSWLLGLLATGVLLTVGSLFFDDVDLGSPVAVGVLLMTVVAAATSIMFLIAKVARTAEQAGVAQTIVAITLGMSGGAFFRVSAEGWMGQILQINPVQAMSRGLGITSGGGGVLDLAPVLLSMVVFAAVMLTLAVVVPGRKDGL